MSANVAPIPRTIYLNGETAPVCAILHPPVVESARDTAVLLCPPFGWDEVCSYRARREWAQRLSEAGYPALRLSLPATGDSGGDPRDSGLVGVWTEAIAATARWLRSVTGAAHLTAIGIGLGGLLSLRATAHGAAIDDLVLWATPGRAKALVRELRAFSKLESAGFQSAGSPPLPPLPPGDLEAGGFLLSAETIEELERVELTALELPAPEARRVLLLGRDGLAVDAKLCEALERSGVSVTVGTGTGYAAMTAGPQQARTPLETIETVTVWLAERSAPMGPLSLSTASGAAQTPITTPDGSRLTETPFPVAQPFGALAGILTEPLEPAPGDLCGVLLNAGAIRRIGPGRMWVETARRWAAQGVPTLRLDVEGIGDADGDSSGYFEDAGLYVPELVVQTKAAIDALQQAGVGQRFVLAGLCSGAYWSFQAAVEDPRVVAALMLNPRALVWEPTLRIERKIARTSWRFANWRKATKPDAVGRALADLKWSAGAGKRLIRSRTGRLLRGGDELDRLFDRLRGSDTRALLVFSDNEPLHDELVRNGHMARLHHYPNVTVEHIPVADHTLRPIWAQTRAHEALDRALARELERTATAVISSGSENRTDRRRHQRSATR